MLKTRILFLTLALCFYNCPQMQAQKKAPTFLELNEKPQYTEFNSQFKVEKIEYHESILILYFMVVHPTTMSGTYYPPNHAQAWFLRDEKGRTYPLQGLINLSLNNKMEKKYVTEPTQVFDNEHVNTNIIRCQLYFDRLPDDVQIVDLIEGVGFEYSSNSYNALKIKVKSFPKKPLPRA
jgi:hypothetical protein